MAPSLRAWRNHPSQLQLHQDHVDQFGHRGPSGFYDEVRCLAVKRIALFVEAAQPAQRVGNLQQGSIAIVAHTAEYLFRHGPQIDDVACIPQALAVLRPEHGAAAGGENAGKTFRQIMDDRLFDVAESVLALTLEKIANRAAQALLDHVVGIGE